MPAKSLTHRLSSTLLIFIAGKKIWLQLILSDKWRGKPERQQSVLTAVMQVGSRVGIRIQSDLTGTPLGGIASGTGRFHLPLQLWVKPPRVPAKNARFFSSWSTLTISVDNKYPYHFCKWVRFFITSRVKVLSESTPPMLLHTEWHSGYLTLKRWYFGSRWDWVNWLGARRKAVRGESKILHSTSSTQIL